MSAHSARYALYMRSPLWHFRRWLWFVTSDQRCEDCGCELVLHRRECFLRPDARVLTVHHGTYARLGHERRSDVRLLCWPCHCRRDRWRR